MSTSLEDAFFNLSPPRFGREGASSPNPKYPPGNFLDTHLDENLILRRVQLHPTLLTELASLVDAKLNEFPHPIPDNYYGRSIGWYRKASEKTTAEDIAKIHNLGPGTVAAQLASSILLHPTRPEAVSPLSWGPSQIDTCNHHSSTPFFTEHFFLQINDYKGGQAEYLEEFSPETRPTILSIAKRYPQLAVAMFFCPAAEELLRSMSRIADHEVFPWMANSQTQYAPGSAKFIRPSDNPHPPWSVPKLLLLPPQDCGIRRSNRRESPLVEYCAPGRITPIPTQEWRDQPEVYIQRAWANAVRADASVMILDCGNYLRVGIRHRATQILLLSDLVDVCHCKNPAYGKIWAGIHLAIVEDVLQRHQIAQELSPDITPSVGDKRPSLDDEDGRPRKKSISPPISARSRTRKHSSAGITKTNKDLASRKPLPKHLNLKPSTRKVSSTEGTVTQMNNLADSFSRHNALSIYVRLGIQKYLTVLLKNRLGTGATGDVFIGTVPTVKHGPIVVKLATTYKRLCRLRHEHSIYTHLTSAGVKCIPRVFGFYQDGHRHVGALILSHDGSPLGSRSTRLSSAEKNHLRDAMTAIHGAGVLHRDLRVWNILVDGTGRITIIDFDRANTTANEQEFYWETERLEKLLRGEYINDAHVIGKDGMPGNIGELVNDNGDV
ncbi:hypothetical protein BDZ89DRAFT_1072056, partial [Hymenopellis radicata]